MRLEFKEHELERALEQYLQLQFNKEVRVNGFDLSGMRSKDGLTAMVDITLLGETDQREPKEESANVNPTNTAWRNQLKQEEEPKQSMIEKSDEYYQVLELLGSNPKNCNRKAIEALIEDNSVLVQQLSTVALYQDWLNQCLKDDALVNQQENSTQLNLDENSQQQTSETEEPTLDDEERAMDTVVLTHPNLEESDDGQVTTTVLDQSELTEEAEEALINSMVTVAGTQEKTSIVDEVTNLKEPAEKTSLFGTPLHKPTRRLFG